MHLWNIILLVGISYCSLGYAQDDFERFRQEQLNALEGMSNENVAYTASVTREIQIYLDEQSRLFEVYKTEVENKWDAFKSSNTSTLVEYSEDFSSRSSVDFEKGEVIVEVLVEDTPAKSVSQKRKAGEQSLERALNKVLTKPAGDNQAILKDQILTSRGHPVTVKDAQQFSRSTLSTQPVQVKTENAKDGVTRLKYSVKVQMVPDHIEVRAKRFKAEILKQAKRFDIDPAVAFAIMQTESYFNPRARSHIPAYGLMQLVPSSGARDAYSYIYKRDKLLDDDYLYIPANNIELGCAYISKLKHVYFGDIKDTQSAYYCTISAYNTGPGNVARALTGNTKLAPAAKVANSMTPDQLYRILKSNLPHGETKDYLEKVTSRLGNYQSWSN